MRSDAPIGPGTLESRGDEAFAAIQHGPILARIAVPVTSVWQRPPHEDSVRDGAVLHTGRGVAEWVSALDLTKHEALHGRIGTQALLGEPALLLSQENGWAQIRLPWQPSASAVDGYPGWVPVSHLIEDPAGSVRTPSEGAVVSARLTTAEAEDGTRLELSFGTVLPLVDSHTVRHPDGRILHVQRDAMRVRGEDLVDDLISLAQQFLRLPYLWAGLSGYGVDCSGLVHLVNRAAGRIVPRDARDQSVWGDPVRPPEIRPGDAIYLENHAGVHHTGFAIDEDRLLHSPRTGKNVEIGSIRGDYPGEWHAFRRFER